MITKSEKRRRHDSNMPRINTIKHQHNTYQLPYRHTNKWRKFYGSKAWYNLRETKLRDNPLCEHCITDDKIVQAQCVHHILPFSQGLTDEQRWLIFLDYDNLMSLCNECHRKIHAGMIRNDDEHEWISSDVSLLISKNDKSTK